MAKVFINPLIETLVMKLREPNTEKKDFRSALEKLGEYLAVEVSKELETIEVSVKTVMGEEAKHKVVAKDPILITILRAGLPFHSGMLKVFENSESGFIGAMRNEETLEATISYIAVPDIQDKVVLITDTMLATGGSIIVAIKQLKKRNPRKIIITAAIAAQEGIKNVKEFDSEIQIYSAVVDPHLNEKGYIVPGLGDAGDRSYGLKV